MWRGRHNAWVCDAALERPSRAVAPALHAACVGLGRLAEEAPEGASVGGKICQAPPAPSSPAAWCSPLGSVADTEGFFCYVAFLSPL